MSYKKAIIAPFSILLLATQAMLGMEAADRQSAPKTITLVSSEGKQFPISAEAVYLSNFLNDTLCLANAKDGSGETALFADFASGELTFELINSAVLEKVALLVNTVHEAIETQKNSELPLDAMIRTPKGYIIAKNLQPVLNKLLGKADIDLLIDLLQATDFLDMPECLNAVASVCVANMRSESKLTTLDAFEGLLEKYEITNYEAIYQALLKQWRLQAAGIEAEWSIADLIATGQNLQPIPDPNYNGMLTVTLLEKGVTSLDGLNLIPQIDKVQVLVLHQNHITEIGAGALAPLVSLQALYLSNNQLSSLDKDLFQNNAALQYLDLKNNRLTRLDPQLFAPLINLEWLCLHHDKLSSLDKDLFQNNAALQILDLENNQLTLLDPQLFAPLTQLEELQLHHNQLSSLDQNLFQTNADLQYLYLNDNQLTLLDPQLFAPLTQLGELQLNHNQLNSLDQNLFQNNAALRELGLNHNQLTQLDPQLFAPLINLELLWLGNNQLTPENLQAIQTQVKQVSGGEIER